MGSEAGSNAPADRRVYAGSDATAPAVPADLTPQWATEAMRAAGTIGDTEKVTAIASRDLDGEGRPMTGDLVRCNFTYEPAGAGPEQVIAKFASQEPVTRGLIEQSDSYAREIYFYRDFGHRVPLRIPAHYGSGLTPGKSRDRPGLAKFFDALPARLQVWMVTDPTKLMRPTKRSYALLMEDCSDTTTVHNMVNPPAPEKLAVELDSLAHLHASFWGKSAELASHPCLGYLGTRTPKLYANEVRLRSLEVARDHWSDWWTDQDEQLAVDAARRVVDDVLLLNKQITLVHGDPRSDNVLFDTSDGTPTFVDWAYPAFGHPAWDVSYTLSSSLAVEHTEAAGDLIDGYRKSLQSHGVSISAADLNSRVRAGWRIQTVMLSLSPRVTTGGYDAVAFYDYWMPRLLALQKHTGL